MPIEMPLVRNIFSQILDGVNHLHNKQQVAHLDLKLENVLLMKNLISPNNSEMPFIVKICDLGLS